MSRSLAWLPRRRASAPAFAATTQLESTLSQPAWQRRQRATQRWALAGAAVGMLAALVAFAPAAWLARAVAGATDGRLLLADARGTLWSGSAVAVLTGGTGSRDAASLPGRLAWSLRWRGRGVDLTLRHACCLNGDVVLHWQPAWARHTVLLRPPAEGIVGQWPAAWLGGLGTPWNTLQLGGRARLAASSASVEWVQGRVLFAGTAQLDLVGMSSRLATIDPLGSYRLTLQGAPGGTTTVQLATLEGALRLAGSGQITAGRLRFQGQGQAAPGSEAALNNLLNIIGRRQGALAVITIG